MKKLLTMLMMLAVSLSLWAYDFDHNGLYYEYMSDTEVKLVRGETDAYKAVSIPATIEYKGATYTVTAIGNDAFYGHSNLESAIIPASVTLIGENAFGDCWLLNKISITAKTPPTISENTFNWKEASISVPEGCIEAYRNAEHWSNCANFEELAAGGGIGFEYEGLHYQTLSYSEAELIWGETETNNQSVITIPATVKHEGVSYTVTSIRKSTFSWRENLTSITIPESITYIGEYAFDCWSLNNITMLAQTPPTIHYNTFSNWDASVSVPEGCEEAYRNAEYWSKFTNYIAPGGGISFEYEGFYYQTLSDTEVELVRGETEAYYQSEITIPATVEHEGVTYTVTAIGNEAFAKRDMNFVTIPESITHIGEYAFYDCWSLSNITVLAQTPPTIHEYTFSNWDTSVSVPYGCEDTYRQAEYWSNFNNYKESAAPGSGIEFEKDGFYYKTLSYTEVMVTYGGNYSGYVTVPKTVEYEGVTYNVSGIDYEAFGYCPDLTTLDIHENIKYIKGDYLRGNEQVLTIVMRSLNPPMHADPYGGFYKGAWTLTIPYEAHSLYQERGWIGEYKLTYLDGFEPFNFEVDGIRYEAISNSKVKVISNTTPYSGNVVVPSVVEYDGKTYNVTTIGDDAFLESTELTSVTLPEGITTIGKNAFAYCSGLSEITIPSTVTYIGDYAFNACNNLHTVNVLATTPPQIEAGTFPASVMIVVPQGCESVYKNAEHWSNLFASASVGQRIEINGIVYLILSETEVAMTHRTENIDESYYEYTGARNIPSTILYKGNTYNVVAIDSYAFYKAGYCGAVDVPASVTTIGSNAFTGHNDIQFVIIRSTTPPQVKSDSFENGCIIYVPDGCVDTYANDKNWKRWKNYIKEMPIIDNGIWYEPVSDNEVAVMCNYQSWASWGDVCSDYAGDITIPETVVHNDVTYQVTTIDTYAFGFCERLNSVTLPATITNIKNRAFLVYYAMDGNCALDTLTVLATTPPQVAEDSFNAYYETVLCVLNDSYRQAEYWKNFDKIIVYGSGVRFEDNGIAYETLSTDKVAVVAKENDKYSGFIDIPSTVTYEGVTYKVTEIASEAFSECYALDYVYIGNGVEIIGSMAFRNCQTMFDIYLPSTLKEIGNNAFESCSGLTNVIIPEGVTAIASYAYSYCTSINTLVLPSTLLSIGEGAFSNNWALIQIECDATTPPQLASDMFYGHVVLYVPEGCVDAYRNAEYWSNITNIKEFPFEVDGLYYEVISDNTVAVMPNRKERYSGEINIPATIVHNGATYQVTTIGKRAFAHSYDITEFVIPPHITTIEESAFESCSSLTSMTIPATVMSIGNNAFNRCTLMTSVVIEDSDEALALGDLCDGSSLYELYLGRNLIYDAYSISSPFPVTLTTVTIGDKVTSLSVGLFCDCWLQTIKLGKNVTEIGNNAFQSCLYLQTIEWNDKVNFIGHYAFYQCYALKSIELPAGIQAIEYATFSECNNLKKVVIPAGVSYISEYAFYDCNNLSSIEVKAATPPTLQNKNVFADATYNSAELLVEYGCIDAYKDALYWNEFRHIIERSSDDYFTIDEISASRGSCVTIPVELINKNVISSFQADLYLPAGIELMKKNGEYMLELSNRATTSHIITAAEQSDGAMRILCYSSQVEALTGNDGELFSMAVEIASNFNGESNIQMKNIKLITPDNTELPASELNVELLLTAGNKGDANSDGNVDIADINTVAGYIVSPAGRQINLTQADVSEDGDVNVIDLVGVSNIILGEMAPQAARARQKSEENALELAIDNFNMSAGSTYEVAVRLDNAVDVSAFQLDIVLPEGLSIQKNSGAYDIDLTTRKVNHVIQSADLRGNAVRVLAYSPSSKTFAENSGELFTFTVVADNSFKCGDIEVKNIVFSQKNMTAHKLPNAYAAVNGGNSVERVECDNYTIGVDGGHIYINGAALDEIVRIYTINGMLLHSTTADNVSGIALQQGIYIVVVNGAASKVVL